MNSEHLPSQAVGICDNYDKVSGSKWASEKQTSQAAHTLSITNKEDKKVKLNPPTALYYHAKKPTNIPLYRRA